MSKQQQRMQKVVRRLDPDLLERELAALEKYIADDAPNRRMQLMAFGAKVALQFAIDPIQHAAPTRLLDCTKFALKMKHRRPPQVPVLVEKKQQHG